MLERLTHLWRTGQLDQDGLGRAVARGWVTQEQADAIAALPQGGSDEPG
jgi:hypothetical protein